MKLAVRDENLLVGRLEKYNRRKSPRAAIGKEMVAARFGDKSAAARLRMLRPHHCQHDGRDSGTQRRSVGKHRRADAGHLRGDCDNTRRQTRGKENRSITTPFFIFPASRRHRRRGACGAVHCLKFSNFPGLWQKNRIKFLSKDIIY